MTRDSPGDTPVTVSVRVDIETKWGYQIVSNGVEVSGVRVVTDVPRKLGSSQQGGEFHSVCDRTEAVRTAILSELADVEDCADVDANHLRILSSLYLYDSGVTSLKAGDFDDLLLLEILSLRENGLTSLPDGIFSDDLTNLRHLNLNDNGLTSLPEGVFDNLAGLRSLELSSNRLEEMQEGVFDNLTNLTSISLESNEIGELPDGVFDNLSSLTSLGLSYNGIEQLPDGIFDGLTALQHLDLDYNDIDELPDDIFDSVSDLRLLSLSNNNLTAVPSVISGLSQLESLNLGENSIEDLPSGTFDSLTSLTYLGLFRNRIRELPDGIFDQLGQLKTLYISTNRISELPEGVFDSLTYLEVLDFSRNSLIELPDGAFEGLTNLRSVSAEYNYVSPLVLTTRLERLGDTELAVKVVEAAPFDIEVELTADHGSLSTSTVTVAAGSTRSDSITVTPSGTDPVTVSMSSARFITDQSDRIAGIEIGLGRSLTPSQDTEVNEQATGAPVITGTAVVGETLTASTSTIADANGVTASEFRFFWIHSDGETDSHILMTSEPEYTVTHYDIGKSIKVRVKFTDDADYEETLTSTSTAMVPIATPRRPYWVEVHASDARELSVSWAAPHDGGSAITGYTVQWKKATGWDSWDTDADASSTTTDETAYTISGLTHGTRYTIRVIATNDLGNSPPSRPESAMAVARVSHEPNTPATGAPSISGTARVGETLTVDASGIADSDGRDHAIFAYQWLRVMGTTSSGTRISLHIQNATSASYLVTTDDVGHALEVLVSFIDDTGNRESRISAATAVAVATAPGAPASVDVQPSGTGRLAVSWEAPASDGGSPITGYKVQWKEATESWDTAADVSSATTTTETSYTISSLTLQTEYAVRVVATNSAGDGPASEEASAIADAQTSQQQDAVQNSPASGQPTINGTAAVDQTLTVGISGIADEDGLDNASFTYQWLADDTDIAGATSTSYTLTDSDQGKTIKVRASFTDDAGNEEALTSEATATVTAPPNSAATGQPQVVGTALVGARLSVDTSAIADANGLSGVQYRYQWLTSEDGADTEIAGATGSSYRLTWREDGKSIKVRVSFRDDAGYDESLTSPALHPIRPSGLVAAVSGETVVLSWEPPTGFALLFDYRILREAPDLAENAPMVSTDTGNSATSYTDRDVEPGVLYRYRVQAANYWNQLSPASEAVEILMPEAEPAANTPATGLPTISGIPQVGQTLTASVTSIADRDGLDNAAYAYRWLADNGTIAGATAATYTLTSAEQGKTVNVAVTFTDDAGNAETLTSAATAAVKPANTPATGQPTISGTARAGETLTADTSGIDEEDGLTNVSFSYQWMADDADISGATNASYTLTSSEEGKAIKVRVSFTDDAGNDETLTSAATDAGAPPPTPLTASIHDAPESHDGENSFTFEIRFSETPVSNFSHETLRDHAFTATGGTVTNARRIEPPGNVRWEITVEPSSDADATIVLPETTDCDDQGAICTADGRKLSAEAALTVAGPEEEEDQTPPENNQATGAPDISGTAQVGETLTANTSGIADPDGLSNASFSYQWIRNDGSADTDIQDATGSTYTLTSADEGKTVKVRVSFTDDGGNDETLASDATGDVAAAPNRAATGTPTISGTVQVGETLTANTSGIADEDGLDRASFSYQWIAGGTDIDGASGSSYTLPSTQQGKTIQVRVSFTDNAGNQEYLTSAPTGAVAAAPSPLTVSLTAAAPASHDGSAAFTFEIRFSEEPDPDFSYKTLRDHAFTATGGSVKTAQRLQKDPISNIGWLVTVEPGGNGDVTIVLPVTTDCDADGAVCTEDGRKLSNSLNFTVSGPGG